MLSIIFLYLSIYYKTLLNFSPKLKFRSREICTHSTTATITVKYSRPPSLRNDPFLNANEIYLLFHSIYIYAKTKPTMYYNIKPRIIAFGALILFSIHNKCFFYFNSISFTTRHSLTCLHNIMKSNIFRDRQR